MSLERLRELLDEDDALTDEEDQEEESPDIDRMSPQYIPRPKGAGVYEGDAEEDDGAGQWVKEKGQAFAGGLVGTAESMLQGLDWLGVDVAGELAEPLTEMREEWLTPEHQTIANDVAGGFGSMVAFLIPGLGVARGIAKIPGMLTKGAQLSLAAIKALKYSGIAISTGMEALSEAGSVYTESQALGKTEEEASQDALETFVFNAAVLGFTNKLSGFFDAGGTFLRKGITGTLSEGAQEGLQSVISQYETTGEVDLQQAGYEAMIGGIVGGGTGGIISVIDRKVARKEEGYDPKAALDLGEDPKGLNAGLTNEQLEEAKEDVRIKSILNDAINKADIKVADEQRQEAEKQQADANNAAIRQQQEEAELQAVKKQQDDKFFIDTISTREGLTDASTKMIPMLEESEEKTDKEAAKLFTKANMALNREDYKHGQIKDIQWQLDHIAKNTKKEHVSIVASNLSHLLGTEMKIADRKEKMEEYEDLQLKEAEKKVTPPKPETAMEKIAAKTTREKLEAKRVKPEPKKEFLPKAEPVIEEVVTPPPAPVAPTKKIKTKPETLQEKIAASVTRKKLEEKRRKAEPKKEFLPKEGSKVTEVGEQIKRATLSKVEDVRLSKQDEVDASSAEKQVNKSEPGLVKYDGPWDEVGGQQFTSYKEYKGMPKGQTFIVKNKEVSAKKIKELMDEKSKDYAEKDETPSPAENPLKIPAKDKLGVRLSKATLALWQGGGASVDQHRNEFLGTGEGHQAIAWGHYLSSVEGVGTYYAVWGTTKTGEKVQRPEGARYLHKVELQDGIYLDWQKPVPKKIAKRILAEVQNLEDTFQLFPPVSGQVGIATLEADLQTGTAGKVHDTLVNMNSPKLGSKKDVAEFLNEDIGIDGFQYPVGMLGNEQIGEPGLNYVVFNPSNIKVVSQKRFAKTMAEQAPVFYTEEYTVKETGDKVSLKINANEALDKINEDLFSLKVLKDCVA